MVFVSCRATSGGAASTEVATYACTEIFLAAAHAAVNLSVDGLAGGNEWNTLMDTCVDELNVENQ